MTKRELIKALEGYPDDKIVLIDVTPLYDNANAMWFSIARVGTEFPATIQAESEPFMLI